MRIGIDLGGTKTEVIALDDSGKELYRNRIPTDRSSYESIVKMVVSLVNEAEETLQDEGTIGVGMPGTISARTGFIKNANTTILNGKPLQQDLSDALDREVRCMNDANCLALSEAVDGAGAGHSIVFAVILGTGCGAGMAINGQPLAGHNLVAGEFGHNPLPWMTDDELPGLPCWCGKRGCIERYTSGTGFEEDYARHETGAVVELKAEDIIEKSRNGDGGAKAAFDRYNDRLARSLAHVVNMIDPDIIVLGGGMSNVAELYKELPVLLPEYVFGGEADTPIVQNRHGDSSGVRGAAWLWPVSG